MYNQLKDYFVLKLNHFILTLKEESGNSIGDKILVSDNGKDFNELNQGLNSIDFEFYEDLKVYIPITNKTTLNQRGLEEIYNAISKVDDKSF